MTMHVIKLCTLGVTMILATVTTVVHASFKLITDDSSLILTYKVYQWNQVNKEGNVQDESPQSMVVDYQSGYVADIIGFDFQAGIALDIDNDGYLSSSSLPSSNSDSLDTLAKAQQAYLKTTFGDEELGIDGTYGQKTRHLQSYNDSDSQRLNISSFGVNAAANIHGLNLYVDRINAFTTRHQSSFKNHFKNRQGQTIDNVTIYGVGYEWNGLNGVAEQANSQDYLKKTIVKVYYTLPVSENISVDLDARHGTVEKEGDLYDTACVQNDKYASSYHNLNTTLNVGNAYVGVGYNKTWDGDYDNKLFDGDHGSFNSSLDLEMGYNYEDETAYLVKTGYNFAGYAPGLSVDVWYAKGKNAKNFNHFNQEEVGTHISYDFSGQLNGLSLTYFHTAYHASDDTLTDRDDALGGMYNTNINRIYLTYTHKVF
ncbi:MAG: hypothetical protein KAG53_07040 [Endozoicomonadaceae bacterium]|nr:hypothetical protein [Endozoicomonadaceae bacterium]